MRTLSMLSRRLRRADELRAPPPGRAARHRARGRRWRPSSLARRARSSALDVGDRGEAARGDHRDRHGIGQRHGGVEIEALEHAVAGDVGVDDGGDAGVLEAARELERRQLARSPPSPRPRPCRRAHRCRPRSRPGNAAPPRCTKSGSRTATVPRMTRATPLSSQPSTVAHVADAAAELHRHLVDRLEDRLDRRAVHRLAGEGAVEVDDVQIVEALASAKALRLRGRIALNTVARAMSPCTRRTHWPSFRSMAGNRITAPTSGNWRSAQARAPGSSPGGTACRPCCRGRRWR